MTLPEDILRDRHYKLGPQDSLWETNPVLDGNPTRLLVGWRQSQSAFSMTQATQSGPAPLHVHTYEDETVYILDGSCTVAMGGVTYELTKGDFLYQPRGVPHQWVAAESVSYLNIATPGGVIDRVLEDIVEGLQSSEGMGPADYESLYRSYGIIPLTDEGWVGLDRRGLSSDA